MRTIFRQLVGLFIVVLLGYLISDLDKLISYFKELFDDFVDSIRTQKNQNAGFIETLKEFRSKFNEIDLRLSNLENSNS